MKHHPCQRWAAEILVDGQPRPGLDGSPRSTI
jgi:hypothetical protein